VRRQIGTYESQDPKNAGKVGKNQIQERNEEGTESFGCEGVTLRDIKVGEVGWNTPRTQLICVKKGGDAFGTLRSSGNRWRKTAYNGKSEGRVEQNVLQKSNGRKNDHILEKGS